MIDQQALAAVPCNTLQTLKRRATHERTVEVVCMRQESVRRIATQTEKHLHTARRAPRISICVNSWAMRHELRYAE